MSRSGSTTRTQSKRSVIDLGAAKVSTHLAIEALWRAHGFAASLEAKRQLESAVAAAEATVRTLNRPIARVEAGR